MHIFQFMKYTPSSFYPLALWILVNESTEKNKHKHTHAIMQRNASMLLGNFSTHWILRKVFTAHLMSLVVLWFWGIQGDNIFSTKPKKNPFSSLAHFLLSFLVLLVHHTFSFFFSCACCLFICVIKNAHNHFLVVFKAM